MRLPFPSCNRLLQLLFGFDNIVSMRLFFAKKAKTPQIAGLKLPEEERLINEISANPKSAKAYYDLGYYYSFKQSPRKDAIAAKQWEKTLELDPVLPTLNLHF